MTSAQHAAMVQIIAGVPYVYYQQLHPSFNYSAQLAKLLGMGPVS